MIREKHHHNLLDILPQQADTEYLSGRVEVFTRKGSCIPTAVLHLIGRAADLRGALADSQSASNVIAGARGVRSYATVRDPSAAGGISASCVRRSIT